MRASHLLDYVRAELLDGQGTDVTSELANYSIAKAIVV